VIESTSSAWRTNQVYIAHFAVTDANEKQFYVAQRYSRGAMGLAGAQAEPFKVWIDDWSLQEGVGASWQLKANDADFGIDISLDASKTPTLNGIDGLSQKSREPGNASYYYSITRLPTDGKIWIGEREYAVAGLSWLDREWSTSALAADQQGWDWFALQLDDGSELMIYGLRRKDGGQDSASGGTWVSADGNSNRLENSDYAIEILDTWESPQGGHYPSRWRISVPDQRLEITVAPVIANQELFTTVRYWEGAVDVEGEREGSPITGRGYVELTGYVQ
jgi:predicted secreted hydrolase